MITGIKNIDHRARLHPSYVISYRFGPLWFNEIYD